MLLPHECEKEENPNDDGTLSWYFRKSIINSAFSLRYSANKDRNRIEIKFPARFRINYTAFCIKKNTLFYGYNKSNKHAMFFNYPLELI